MQQGVNRTSLPIARRSWHLQAQLIANPITSMSSKHEVTASADRLMHQAPHGMPVKQGRRRTAIAGLLPQAPVLDQPQEHGHNAGHDKEAPKHEQHPAQHAAFKRPIPAYQASACA